MGELTLSVPVSGRLRKESPTEVVSRDARSWAVTVKVTVADAP